MFFDCLVFTGIVICAVLPLAAEAFLSGAGNRKAGRKKASCRRTKAA